MEKYLNTSLYADCSSHVYDCGPRPSGLAYRQILRRRPLTNLEVLRRLQTPSTRLRGVPPLTAAAAAGTWRGETDASGLHGVDVAVGLAWMLLPVSLRAELTQPGGEVHYSKPVRGKSKG